MVAHAERAGRDAPVTRAIDRGSAQHRGAIGVVKGDRRTRLCTATGDGWRGGIGDVVGTAAACIRAAGQIRCARRRGRCGVNRHSQARRRRAGVACRIGHLGGQCVIARAERTRRDAPVARAICCGSAQHRGAIGVVKRDGRTRLSTAAGDSGRGRIGDVVRAA